MKIRNSSFKIALLISALHCLFGNFIAAKSNNSIVEFMGLPYSFIGGMSNFAGCDAASFMLEAVAFIVITLLFYPIGMLLQKP